MGENNPKYQQFETYIHRKGGVYLKLCEARHTETLEDLVVYVDIAGGDVFCRPKEMFYEEMEQADGSKSPRFKKLPYISDRDKRKTLLNKKFLEDL
ncbi:MAG: DUF1653 domain-containing protein [Rickettsiales bacterium]